MFRSWTEITSSSGVRRTTRACSPPYGIATERFMAAKVRRSCWLTLREQAGVGSGSTAGVSESLRLRECFLGPSWFWSSYWLTARTKRNIWSNRGAERFASHKISGQIAEMKKFPPWYTGSSRTFYSAWIPPWCACNNRYQMMKTRLDCFVLQDGSVSEPESWQIDLRVVTATSWESSALYSESPLPFPLPPTFVYPGLHKISTP